MHIFQENAVLPAHLRRNHLTSPHVEVTSHHESHSPLITRSPVIDCLQHAAHLRSCHPVEHQLMVQRIAPCYRAQCRKPIFLATQRGSSIKTASEVCRSHAVARIVMPALVHHEIEVRHQAPSPLAGQGIIALIEATQAQPQVALLILLTRPN